MSERYEYYIAGDTSYNLIYAGYSKAQTFTPEEAHSIEYVRLKLYRGGNPGTLTVSIRETEGGVPTGANIAVGTINANGFTSTVPGEWYQIDFVTPVDLDADVKYAILCCCFDGSAGNWVFWRVDPSTPDYLRGAECDCLADGASCVENTAEDSMFEEWGSPLEADKYPSHWF